MHCPESRRIRKQKIGFLDIAKYMLNFSKDRQRLKNSIIKKTIDMKKSLLESIDVLVCANDETALGAIEECQRRGIRIPEDLAITGFDGNVCTNPPGTTSVIQCRPGRKWSSQ